MNVKIYSRQAMEESEYNMVQKEIKDQLQSGEKTFDGNIWFDFIEW